MATATPDIELMPLVHISSSRQWYGIGRKSGCRGRIKVRAHETNYQLMTEHNRVVPRPKLGEANNRYGRVPKEAARQARRQTIVHWNVSQQTIDG